MHKTLEHKIVRPIPMRKISEILRLRYELGFSYQEISQSQNVSKGTISEYIRRSKSAGLGWPLPEGMDETGLHNALYLPVNPAKKVRPLPNWDEVCCELRRKGVTLLLLWREYREKHPDGLGYTQFCKRYQAHVKQITPVMKQVHKAGEKTFVDYAGMTVPWLDTATGEIIEAQIFVGSLGASQYTFAEASPSQQLGDWIESHVRMWSYFGGVSKMVVPDNLKSGVTKAHRYDPEINRNYQHVGEHYGFAIVPARPSKPKDKAKVENAVGCIERQVLAPLRDMTFTSIAEINSAIKPLLEKFNANKFQKMDASRKSLFEEIDKPALSPLPKHSYQYASWKKAKVNIDYHVCYKDHYYSVPYNYLHQEIELRVTNRIVECFYKSRRIAAHPRSYQRYKHTTLKEHMPKAHQEQSQEWSVDRLIRWAKKIGPNTATFIKKMIDSRAFPEQAFRSCLGLLRLSKGFGPDRLEAACLKGLEIGSYRYQQIQILLKNRMESISTQPTKPSTANIHHQNIRGSNYYQ